jgi:hypothetical protein
MVRVLIQNRRSMRPILALAVVLGGLSLASPSAQAQTQNCLVRQAADAAIQRQIALIDAAKVNPSSFFNGANSCIAADLLKRFDLSNLIPDASGFLTSGVQSLISSVMDAAKRQVCQILDNQLRSTISSINSSMGGFQNSLSGDLFRQLNGSISPITIPNITGIGTYTYTQNNAFGSALNLAAAPTTLTTTPTTTTTTTDVPAATTVAPNTSPAGSSFGGMYQ